MTEIKASEIKQNIQDNREAEQYVRVTKKYSDQASMLRVLNQVLRDEKAEKTKLAAENSELKHKLGRNVAFQDCVEMITEILEKVIDLIGNAGALIPGSRPLWKRNAHKIKIFTWCLVSKSMHRAPAVPGV